MSPRISRVAAAFGTVATPGSRGTSQDAREENKTGTLLPRGKGPENELSSSQPCKAQGCSHGRAGAQPPAPMAHTPAALLSDPARPIPRCPSVEMSPDSKALEESDLSGSLNPASENSGASDLPTVRAGKRLSGAATTCPRVMLHPTGSPTGGCRGGRGVYEKAFSQQLSYHTTELQAARTSTHRSLCTRVTNRR